jgi:hypothetical protein
LYLTSRGWTLGWSCREGSNFINSSFYPTFDLAEIAESSHLSIRKIRYVLDNGLLPGGKVASRGRGAARRFTGFEAFGIATATLMLEAGLRRALVRDCMTALCRAVGRDVHLIPLYRAYEARGEACLKVGDWLYMRLLVEGSRPTPSLDTGWLPLTGTEPASPSYAPLVCLSLDVAQVRGRLNVRK